MRRIIVGYLLIFNVFLLKIAFFILSLIYQLFRTEETKIKKTKKSLSHRPGISTDSAIQSILRAYLALSHEIGVSNITLQKIADRAGVAFGTVRYYFSNTERNIHDEAFMTSMNHAYEVVEEILLGLRKKGSTFHPVHGYVDAIFKWISDCPTEGSYLIYHYYLSATKVKLKVPASITIDNARLRIEGLLHEAIGKGIYQRVVDSVKVSAQIHALVVGFGFIALGNKDTISFNAQKALCKSAVDAIVSK